VSAKNLMEEIASAWSWTGLRPRTVVAESDFGNPMVEDIEGRFRRICPEALSNWFAAPSGSMRKALCTELDA
jgi:hypothetical protein